MRSNLDSELPGAAPRLMASGMAGSSPVGSANVWARSSVGQSSEVMKSQVVGSIPTGPSQIRVSRYPLFAAAELCHE